MGLLQGRGWGKAPLKAASPVMGWDAMPIKWLGGVEPGESPKQPVTLGPEAS